MPDPGIASSAGPQPQRRRGRPRTHVSDAARKRDWWRRNRQRQKGMSTMPQVLFETLYCAHCCCRQRVSHDGAGYHCSLCKRPVQPPSDLAACPRSSAGHNPYRTADGVVCSLCWTPLPHEANR
jgi:hypothetical protein